MTKNSQPATSHGQNLARAKPRTGKTSHGHRTNRAPSKMAQSKAAWFSVSHCLSSLSRPPSLIQTNGSGFKPCFRQVQKLFSELVNNKKKSPAARSPPKPTHPPTHLPTHPPTDPPAHPPTHPRTQTNQQTDTHSSRTRRT